jgi:hypothetical protein
VTPAPSPAALPKKSAKKRSEQLNLL